MKRAIIAEDGVTVENVIVLPHETEGHDLPAGIDLPRDTFVGPGMVWNGDLEAPDFADPAVQDLA